MRSLNGIELLNLIGEHGPVSRASLAKISRLSKPTVSSQVEELIRQGWVLEVGPGESGERGGKKPMLVKFNADAGRLFAAEIDASRIRVAVCNLEGEILDRTEQPIRADREPATVMNALTVLLRKYIKRQPSEAKEPRVISVAAPGRVDVRRGIVLQAGNLFNWSDVPIRATLEKTFDMPVFVDNDVNMATLGETHFGIARGVKDVVVVRLETGIGAGVVIRGKLLHGAHWAAGEIAHMSLTPSPASEEWRLRGYLESMIGADRITSQLGSLKPGGAGPADVSQLLEQASKGNNRANKIYQDVVNHAGAAIANLICTFDPGLVVLQGKLFQLAFDQIHGLVSNAVPWESKVVVSAIADDAVLFGAMAAARAQAYERIARLLDESTTQAPEQVAAAG